MGISYLTGVQTQPAITGQQGFADAVLPFAAQESSSRNLPTAGTSTFALTASQLFRSWVGWRKSALAAAALVICAAIGFLASRLADHSRALPPEIAIESARDSATASKGFDARTVRIDSGSARITLPKVGYMLIDGPAEVDLLSPLRAKLIRGRIRVRVTLPTGHGFVVETPDGNVTDLSTEFGLEVAEGKKTGVVVFDGEVDLHVKQGEAAGAANPHRLVEGEAVAFNRQGELDRISSITTGQVATFQADGTAADRTSTIITRVSDNLWTSDTKKFYEIVPGGFRKDAVAYVDRMYEWKCISGSDSTMRYLEGADYVKMFNDDKLLKNIEIQVTLSQPAKLYVLFDNRVKVPDWLEKDYRKLKDGLQLIGYRGNDRVYCRFNVWERVVPGPGTIKLGPCNAGQAQQRDTSMYAIAAVPLERRKIKSD
jgi:hypothetical protein